MQIADNAGEAIGTGREGLESLIDWISANREALPMALLVAAGIVGVMLILRWLGSRLITRDPECSRWTGVVGRVFDKTTVFFMVATALDIVATYAAVPSRLERLFDIIFVIAFAFQGAIWARELILGAIGRRVGEDSESTLSNAQALVRVLVSVLLFALAIIVILDNLGVNVTALVAGLGIGGIAIGLAAQGIFSDLFAALAIVFDRPLGEGRDLFELIRPSLIDQTERKR